MEKNQFVCNQIINVQAYKHNGQLYRQWNGAKIIHINDDELILLLFKTKVQELKGQKWMVCEPMLWWLPLKKFFNTTAMMRTNGVYYYTNIASPPIFEDNTLKFIDYDLDIKNYPKIKNKLVDKKEFADNTKRLDYSLQLLKKIDQAIGQVLELNNKKQHFFNPNEIKKIISKLINKKYLSPKFNKL